MYMPSLIAKQLCSVCAVNCDIQRNVHLAIMVGMDTQIHACSCTMPTMVSMMHVYTVIASVCSFLKYIVDVLA